MNKSFLWSTIEKSGQFIVQLVISILLSRLLIPEDFGSIAMLSVITILANTVVDSGFSQGLIRKLECTDNYYNSVFWFNLIISIIIYILLFAIAPIIGFIFKNKELVQLSRVLFLVIPIGALNIIQVTKIVKELNFKAVAIYMVLASLISGLSGVFFALSGFGVWSLVIQILLNSILITLFTWLKSQWRPNFSYSFAPIKDLFSFSSKLFLSTFLNNLFNNLYIIIIGKFYTPQQLGIYSQAYKFATQPGLLLDSILSRLTYPILSKYQNSKVEYLNYYIIIQKKIIAFMLLLMFGIIIISKELILLILGDKWIAILPYFQILCIAAITFPIHPLSISTMKVYGFSKLILKLEMVKKLLMIFLIGVTIPFGIKALVYGQVSFYIAVLPLNMYYGGKIVNYYFKYQMRDVAYYLLSFISSFIICIYFSTYITSENLIIQILLKGFIYLTLALSILLILKPSEFKFFLTKL